MGDIQQMFYQVNVAETTNFLRFLWWPEGDLSQEFAEHRRTVHLLRAVSSTSCACYALRKTAEDNQASFPAEVIKTVRQNFYVDDCLKSTSSEEKAIQAIKDITALCQKGGFHLTKWVSNSRTVLRTVPEEHRAKDLKALDLDRDNLPLEKALSLQWCIERDSFQFRTLVKNGLTLDVACYPCLVQCTILLGIFRQSHCLAKSCCRSCAGETLDGMTAYLVTYCSSGLSG